MENYSIYKFTFSDGKTYIGQTNQNVEKRWNKGKGYIGQEVYGPIISEGWNNIKKEVLHSNLSKEYALKLEQYYIQKNNSVKNGYNRTKNNSQNIIKNIPAELELSILEKKIVEKLPILKSTSPNRLLTFSELRSLEKITPNTEVIFEYQDQAFYLTTAEKASNSVDAYEGGCGKYTFCFLSGWRVWIGNPDIKLILVTPWLSNEEVKRYNSAFIRDKEVKNFYLKHDKFPTIYDIKNKNMAASCEKQ